MGAKGLPCAQSVAICRSSTRRSPQDQYARTRARYILHMRFTKEASSLPAAPRCWRRTRSVVGTAVGLFGGAWEGYDVIDKAVRGRARRIRISRDNSFHDLRVPDRGDGQIVGAVIFVPEAARQRVDRRDRLDEMSVSRTLRNALVEDAVHSQEQEVVVSRCRAPHLQRHLGQQRSLFGS